MTKRVLIVEDSADLRLLYSHVLRLQGIETDLPATAQAALDSLQSGPLPDLILLDLTMPDVSGEDFIRTIRSEPRLTSIPVWLVSGRDDVQAFAESLRADGFLQKPVEMQTLHQLIEEQLRH